MTERIDRDRRRFLGTAAMTIAGAHLGVSGNVEANQRAPGELAAFSRSTEWFNSPRLTAADWRGKVVLVDFWTYTYFRLDQGHWFNLRLMLFNICASKCSSMHQIAFTVVT